MVFCYLSCLAGGNNSAGRVRSGQILQILVGRLVGI
jgi:hypothetical protein